MKTGVYQILNMIDNKRYIGSSQDMNARRASHFSALKKNKHHSAHLQNAFNKYGEESFLFSILAETPVEDLIELEQLCLDTANPEYNMRLVADSPAGTKRSEEHKELMRHYSSIGRIGSRGMKHSKETIERMREVRRGKVLPQMLLSPSKETREKLSEAKKGKYPRGLNFNAKPVTQLSLDGDIVGQFDCLVDAAVAVNSKPAGADSISLVCKNKKKSYKGYNWLFINETN